MAEHEHHHIADPSATTVAVRENEDTAYRNAKKYSDRQNARIEHDTALKKQITASLQENTELYKKFTEDPDLQNWLSGVVFAVMYTKPNDPQED